MSRSNRPTGAQTPERAAVQTSGLTKRYGDVVALAPIDLVIGRGQRVAVIGHNGSGKTTLIKMLVGLLEPTAGSARVGGHPAGSLDGRACVSYLSDDPVFYDDLSLDEHLEYVARLHGVENWRPHADELLDRLGVAHRRADLPATFSRGLRQKSAIALAFVRPFETLLVDEPFVGLDQAGRRALVELLASAHADGATVVVATHELSTVPGAQRVIALADGEVVHDAPPDGVDVASLTERRS
jgi:ABC-type multidrug transport system ATPase subunit